MKRFLLFAIFIGICCLLIAIAPATSSSTSAAATAAVEKLSPVTNHELARARNATAKYHDFSRAMLMVMNFYIVRRARDLST